MSVAARRPPARRWVWLAVIAGVVALLAANAHLVYVAFTSQPDCVAHSKTTGTAGTYMAADSAC
jgi:hypothetical protein